MHILHIGNNMLHAQAKAKRNDAPMANEGSDQAQDRSWNT
jgi:hypothetical protein